MMARSSIAPSKGRIQKRKTNVLQIIIFGLQRAAGPYRWVMNCRAARPKARLLCDPIGNGQMAIDVGRRQFISALGGASLAWPLAARAQQPTPPVVGFLNSASASAVEHLVQEFRDGLGEAGYIEGRNVAIEYRWAEGHIDRLPALAVDLVQRQVAVIVTGGGDVLARAGKAVTSAVSIVSTIGGDPVKEGLVASFNRPGGNLTGATVFANLAAKRLELLHELIPNAVTIMALFDPSDPVVVLDREAAQAASKTLGLQLRFANAGTVSK